MQEGHQWNLVYDWSSVAWIEAPQSGKELSGWDRSSAVWIGGRRMSRHVLVTKRD